MLLIGNDIESRDNENLGELEEPIFDGISSALCALKNCFRQGAESALPINAAYGEPSYGIARRAAHGIRRCAASDAHI